MGDSIEGSSSAAQGAHAEGHTEPDENNGFFRRVMGIFTPDEENDGDGRETSEPVGGVPGIGNLRHMAV
ncbi:MAG: magnesium/cobalt efflux protein, partial [Gammaproteobacteria bacterium]